MEDLKDIVFPANYPFNTVQDVLDENFNEDWQSALSDLLARYHKPRQEIVAKVHDDMVREHYQKQEELHKKMIEEEAKKHIEVPIGTDKCLWNRTEIQIIRQLLNKTREENMKISAQNQVNQQEIQRLHKVVQELQDKVEKYSDLAVNYKKNYKTTRIKKDHYKQQLSQYHDNLKSVKFEVDQLQRNNYQLDQENQALKVKLNRTTIHRNQLSELVQDQQVRFQIDTDEKEQVLRKLHDDKLKLAHKKMDKLKLQLENERQQHEACKQALEHLRKHFLTVNVSSGSSIQIT